MVTPMGKIGATICYEAMFPPLVRLSLADGAPFMVNLTNDGWFGRTPGPYQHFSHSRLRSIEEGLPLVRAANTGISAIIDPFGNIINSLPVGVEGVLDGALPKPLKETFFSKWPNFGPLSLLLGMLVGAIVGKRRGREPLT